MRIDLHAHSDVSDGTEPPALVMAQAKRAGLDVVALTDHDTWAGWDQAAEAAAGLGLGLVRGTEFSTRMDGITAHILAYLHNPAYGPLVELARSVKRARRERAQAIVERLARDYPITWEQVEARAAADGPVGRPHIADQLVAAGAVPDRSAAFAELLHPRGHYYVPYWSADSADTVRLIRQAGGVPVFAHPGATARNRLVGDDGIVRLKEAGLAGLEVRHRDNPPEQQARLQALAKRLDLFVTGSSDYHGEAGKPNRLGENLTTRPVLEEILDQGELALAGAA